MANTFELGGSPLGLIGVKSRPTREGMSTFNGGESRNINVNDYNLGRKQITNIEIDGQRIESQVSLLTGNQIPNFFGNIGTNGTDLDKTGISRDYNGIDKNILHSNEVYDTSVLNIIEKMSFSPKAALRPQDFAYLKNLGVYPNNRLMIARRFTEPQSDNIMSKTGSPPLSVMIGWKPQDEEFIDFSFGEEWEDSEADFSGVLNDLGRNFSVKNAGSGLSGGLSVLPLSGVTEVLQRKLLQELKILKSDDESDIQNQPLPSGNPNIIKEAKRRKTISYSESGSGLKATINIKMKVEYEQKFISGIDPTVAWMDILSNIMSFGTSNSSNYGLSKDFENKLDQYTSTGGTNILTNDIINALKKVMEKLSNKVSSIVKELSDGKSITDLADKFGNGLDSAQKTDLINDATNLIRESIEKTINKYRIRLMGITHALSGLPSTPWHITIGNPIRPIFSSGDMLVENVEVKMGSTLAFNDLPANITAEFSLKNARALGMQELLAKFNAGYLRTVNVRRDYIADQPNNKNNSVYYNKIDGVNVPGESITNGNINNNENNNENPGQNRQQTFEELNNIVEGFRPDKQTPEEMENFFNNNSSTKETDLNL